MIGRKAQNLQKHGATVTCKSSTTLKLLNEHKNEDQSDFVTFESQNPQALPWITGTAISAANSTHVCFYQSVDHSTQWEAVKSSGWINCGSWCSKQSNA